MEKKLLGILGGMGAEASSVFYKKIIDNTEVSNDREHIDLLLFSHASIPDRTECILGGKQEYLWGYFDKDIRMLKNAGCDYLVIPCNTSHYFADRFDKAMDGNFLNMIDEAARYAAKFRGKRIGILATDGTVQSNMYGAALERYGAEAVYPSEECQKDVMSLIYDQIKRGEKGDKHQFLRVIKEMKEKQCDAVILACTELSVLKDNYSFDGPFYLDAMDVITKVCIEKCGGKYCGSL
ncbi:MAG: amino acid racemase [Eubacterium sp.]|nr:amino acid racemase [Eubacterium sp.]